MVFLLASRFFNSKGPIECKAYTYNICINVEKGDSMKGKYLAPKHKRKQIIFPAWAFLSVHLIYSELLLYLWSDNSFKLLQCCIIVLFAAGLGCLLGAFLNLFKKVSKTLCLIVAFVVTVLILMEYFILDAYKNFMPLVTIINGAGGVAKDFLGLALSLIANNWWRILLGLLPIFLYGILGQNGEIQKTSFAPPFLGCVISYVAAFTLIFFVTHDIQSLTGKYNFDIAVRNFGLNVAMVADAVHSGSSNDDEFQPIEMQQPIIEETQSQKLTEESIEQNMTIATEPSAKKPIEYDFNTIAGLDFNELATSATNSRIKNMHEYLGSLTPSKKNAYTGIFEGKNLIFITAEAFTKELIDPVRTPTLYRLANKGIVFNDYYQPAWGASTTSGEYSNLTGLVPTNGGDCMYTPTKQDMFLLIGKQLQARNYYSAAYHNHHANFYNRDKTHTSLGYDKFLGIYGGLENVDIVWPESDQQLITATIDDYINNQPFSVYYMTVSGHSVYARNQHVQADKHYDLVADMGYSEPIKCYVAANMELEYALATLVESLEQHGIADDTVIVIGTDHYPYGLEKSSTWSNNKNYLKEWYRADDYTKFVRDHNQLIIWSGCIEDQDIVINEPVYSLDILPTLLNLFGCEFDSRLLVGRDVFSDAQPLVLWMDYSWKTDIASYDASTRELIVNEGVTLPEGYVEYIDALVKNKIKYSKFVVDNRYFNLLPNPLSP